MLNLFKVHMSPNIGEALLPILTGGYITQGPKVEEFEYHLRRFIDIPRILTVNAGTHALQLACHLAGVKDKNVISTPMSCSATNTAILAQGGKIIWADIDPVTGNIDPDSIEDKLKRYSNIAAIMMVHWSGYPCDIDHINFLADKYGVKTIEDAAHAFGAIYKDKNIGATFSDYTCFSFQAIKHLTTVDGGALICKDEADHKRGKQLRWFGIDRDEPRLDSRIELDIPEAGYKFHMNDVNATIGIENLKYLPKIIEVHRRNGEFFDRELPCEMVIKKELNKQSSYWIYTLLIEDRKDFIKFMTDNKIMVSQVHARNDLHSMCKEFLRESLPGVEEFTSKQISIPCGWWITPEDADYIKNTIINWEKLK